MVAALNFLCPIFCTKAFSSSLLYGLRSSFLSFFLPSFPRTKLKPHKTTDICAKLGCRINSNIGNCVHQNWIFGKKYVLSMYRKSDPLDQEKVNNKAMINKTAKMWAKLTLILNVAFFCYRKGKTCFLCWSYGFYLLVIKDYSWNQWKLINNLVFKKWPDVWNQSYPLCYAILLVNKIQIKIYIGTLLKTSRVTE